MLSLTPMINVTITIYYIIVANNTINLPKYSVEPLLLLQH